MILLCASLYAEDESKNTKPVNDNESTRTEEPPEGYYAFVESPNAEPPKVRPPPYIDSDKECYGRSGISKAKPIIVSIFLLIITFDAIYKNCLVIIGSCNS